MAVTIISPVNSFVQFNEPEVISGCIWPDMYETLPVVEDNDLWFQWILQTDTKDEADALCLDSGTMVKGGIASGCSEDNLLTFDDAPERYRIDDTHILYNWFQGVPGFGAVIDLDACFIFKVTVILNDVTYNFCSGIFKRVLDTCFTAVFEYGNDDNFAGFNYCGGISIDQQAEDCDPTEISFTNIATITIPYTAQLKNKYGNIPSVQVWIYDETGALVDMGIRASFDGFPPSEIKVDFGGPASGVIKIN